MNRTDLISAIADRTEATKQTVDEVIAGLEETLLESARRGDRVALPGLLTLDVTERAARTGRNPQDGSTMTIPAARVPRIRAGAKLKKAANGEG